MQQTECSGGCSLVLGTTGAGPAGEDKRAVKHGKAGTVDSEQLWVSGTGSTAALQGRQSQVVQSNSLVRGKGKHSTDRQWAAVLGSSSVRASLVCQQPGQRARGGGEMRWALTQSSNRLHE